MNRNIIAIAGLKNAGKDLVSNMLQYCLSVPKFMRKFWLYKLLHNFIVPRYEITSFASSMKEALSVLTSTSIEKFNDRNFKENWYIKLQTLHVTAFPEKSQIISDKKLNKLTKAKELNTISNYYITIRQLLQTFGTEIIREYFGDNFWVIRTLLDGKNLIISDLRFINEYNQIKKENGITIYVDRRLTSGLHRSENEVIKLYEEKKFDYIIENHGDIKYLFSKVSDITSQIC